MATLYRRVENNILKISAITLMVDTDYLWILTSVWLSQVILGYIWLFWAISAYFELSWTIMNYFCYLAIFGYHGYFWFPPLISVIWSQGSHFVTFRVKYKIKLIFYKSCSVWYLRMSHIKWKLSCHLVTKESHPDFLN